jgi:hypothetical protein
MSELEQLRKEVNELRERVARLEGRVMYHPLPPNLAPVNPYQPPFVVTCESVTQLQAALKGKS